MAPTSLSAESRPLCNPHVGRAPRDLQLRLGGKPGGDAHRGVPAAHRLLLVSTPWHETAAPAWVRSSPRRRCVGSSTLWEKLLATSRSRSHRAGHCRGCGDHAVGAREESHASTAGVGSAFPLHGPSGDRRDRLRRRALRDTPCTPRTHRHVAYSSSRYSSFPRRSWRAATSVVTRR